MAVVSPAGVTPPVPLIPPSSNSPEHGSPPSPTLQQPNGGSPGSPTLQPQQSASVVYPQRLLDPPPPPLPYLAATPQHENTGVQEPSSPRPHPPELENIEPAPAPASPTVNPDHLEQTPPPAEAFAFAGTSAFITSTTMQYLRTISAGPRWVEMVTSYLRLKEFPVMKSVCVFRIVDLSCIF